MDAGALCMAETMKMQHFGGTGGLTMADTTKKLLGKIDFAEFGVYPDRPFMYGLMLGFSFPGLGVMDGGKYTVNISPDCRSSAEFSKMQSVPMFRNSKTSPLR